MQLLPAPVAQSDRKIAGSSYGAIQLKRASEKSPCARAFIDQKDAGLIACAPFEAALGALKKGAHTLEILAFGSRYNGFGTLHCADPNYKWYGPMAYRTEGWQWTDNRILRAGHLTQPIWIIEETINTLEAML